MRMPANADIIRVTLIVGVLVALALLVVQIAEVLLLAFGAIVFAAVVWSLANTIQRLTHLPHGWAFALSVAAIALFVLGFSVLLGAHLFEQGRRLVEALPELLDNLGARLGVENLYERVTVWTEQLFDGGGVFGNVADIAGRTAVVLANLFVVVAAGVFLAAQPTLYRDGVLKLVPAGGRVEAARALGHAGVALRQWLVAQLIAMALVGGLTALGLYLIGIPSALALGFMAGIAEFVPFVGPLAAAIPAVLVAVSEGGLTPVWVILLYVTVQQIEGNVITPLLYRRVTHLPPVLTLFSILALGVLFGPLGVVLSAPLAVVLFVLVKQLYVRDTLKVEASLPGGPAVDASAAATAAEAAPPATNAPQREAPAGDGPGTGGRGSG